MGQDEQGFLIRSTEDDIEWAFGYVDDANLLAGGIVDEDLAVGNVDVAMRIDSYVLPAALGEGAEVCEGAVIFDESAVSNVFRLATYIDAMARLGGEQGIGI